MKDVRITSDLLKLFGAPKPGDNDSDLACMVASARWKGFAVDKTKLEGLKKEVSVKLYHEGRTEADGGVGKIPKAAAVAKVWLHQVMTDEEKLIINSTAKIILEDSKKWEKDDETGRHPAAIRAEKILEARSAEKEIDI